MDYIEVEFALCIAGIIICLVFIFDNAIVSIINLYEYNKGNKSE